MPKLLSIEDLARELHMKPGTIRNRLSRGAPLPPSIRVGRRRLFPAAELEKWLSSMLENTDFTSEAEITKPRGRPKITTKGTRSQLDLLGSNNDQ